MATTRALKFTWLVANLFWINGPPLVAAFVAPRIHHQSQHACKTTRRLNPIFDALDPTPRDKPRRKKKNKYANKAAAPTKDPLELLMEESEKKLKEIEQEKSKPKKLNGIEMEDIEAVKSEPRNFAFPDNKDINPNEPGSFGFVEIGTIIGPHGVHGEVKIKATSFIPRRFTEPGVRYFKPLNKRAPRKVFLVSGKPSKDDEYILMLDSAQDREGAVRLRGGTLFVREEDREPEPKNGVAEPSTSELTDEGEDEAEYYISDLVGLEVFLESAQGEESSTPFVGTVVGVVLSEIPGLGHDMLELSLPRGVGGTVSLRDELVLIPFVPQIVPRVLISEGSVFISPPDGLLDLTYVREEKVRIKGFLPSASD